MVVDNVLFKLNTLVSTIFDKSLGFTNKLDKTNNWYEYNYPDKSFCHRLRIDI